MSSELTTKGQARSTDPAAEPPTAAQTREAQTADTQAVDIHTVDDQTRARLAPWNPIDRISSWFWAGLVTLIALILRLVNIQKPPQIIFDETYYAKDAWSLLNYGYERNVDNTGPGLVAHPPLGKWCIAIGEWLFGYNSFGWRFSAAIAGTISVLLLCRIARRLFRSTLLGCVAGALLALDGLHFVSSRVALLDIFLMLFVLAAFGCLVLDRQARRAQLLATLERGDPLRSGAPRQSWRNWPWWRIAAGVFLGGALSVKWSALWFVIAFVVLVVVWEVQARRSAGTRRPLIETIGWETGWVALFLGIIVLSYVATWAGWFITDDGWDRHWAENNNASVWYLPDAIVSLWHYHTYLYEFHSGLQKSHDYQSTPLGWLILERPVLYYYEGGGDCGAQYCSSTVLALGTPFLWWSFIPALFACAWRWLARRDWRGGTILLCALVGIVPWLLYPDRTMFYFYAVPAVPFLVLAVTLMLGMALGSEKSSVERRIIGAGVVFGYVLLIAITFAYFYPIYTATEITYDQWLDRMWLERWK